MPAVAGLGTTYNLPNYTGPIINVTPQDTPFLSAISGLSAQNFENTVAGCDVEQSIMFSWEELDLRDAEDDRQAIEGADAPAASERAATPAFNVVEIHQETVSLSYSKLAATAMIAPIASGHPNAAAVATQMAMDANPTIRQMRAQWAQIARDVEASFLTGTFALPATNATARRTRGIIEATVTNTTDAAAAALTETMLLDLMQSVWESGGIMESESAAVMVAGKQKRALTTIFVKNGGYRQNSRTVGGVAVDTILTDFGELNVMLNRHMPVDTLQVVSLEQCRPAVLEVPNKGAGFFAEPLAKTGASDNTQLYGEIGLKYGNEKSHGNLTNLG